MEKEKVILEMPNKMVVLLINPFDTDVDVDAITKIQYHNIMGEMLTSSVQLNRIGNLLAEVEEIERHARLELTVFESNRVEDIQKGLVKVGDTTISSKGLSDSKLNHIIVRSPEWQTRRKKVISAAKYSSIVKSLYWALKSKDEKLTKMSEKLRPEEFEKEIVEGVINGIEIRVTEKAVK